MMVGVSTTATVMFSMQCRVQSAVAFAIQGTRAREIENPGFTQEFVHHMQSTLNGSTEVPNGRCRDFYMILDKYISLGGIPRETALREAVDFLTTEGRLP